MAERLPFLSLGANRTVAHDSFLRKPAHGKRPLKKLKKLYNKRKVHGILNEESGASH